MLKKVSFFTFALSALFACSDAPTFTTSVDTVGRTSARTRAPTTETIAISASFISGTQISYSIKPKPGALAKAWTKTYDVSALNQNADGEYLLPITGLYLGYDNEVEITSGNNKEILPTISTLEPSQFPYLQINKIQPPSSNNPPNFSYFLLKSPREGPVVMDIDGEVRWLPPSAINGSSSFYDSSLDAVITAINNQMRIYRWDGSFTAYTLQSTDYSGISAHHDLSKGKTGYLVQINGSRNSDSANTIQSVLLEVDAQGKQVKSWDFGQIIADFMDRRQNDPSLFVRDGTDWFHMNSAIYQSLTNRIIVSSRENFVIAIGYDDNKIKWILGDNSKYWASFSSLATAALDLGGNIPPIGQHAISMNSANELLLFNNGLASFNNPLLTQAGTQLSSSPASSYPLNVTLSFNREASSGSASINWNYNPGIYSDICSSVYENVAQRTIKKLISGKLTEVTESATHYLLTYSAINRNASAQNIAKIRALDASSNILFDYNFPSVFGFCDISWDSSIMY